MPEPLSVYTRRVERLERKLRFQSRMLHTFVGVVVLGFVMALSGVALGVWSSLHGWDAGGPAVGLVMCGLLFAIFLGLSGIAWWDFSAVDEDLDERLDKARDEYDRQVEKVARDAR